MQRFNNILVVVDDIGTSQGAVDAAASLAARNKTRLTIVGLVDTGRSFRPLSSSEGSQIDMASLLSEERDRELQELAAGLDLPDVRTDVVPGVGFVEIVKRIHRDRHDIVFCSPKNDERRTLAGASLAMHLLRKSPVPVWVETPRGHSSPDVAVAVGPFDSEVERLNERLIQLAGSLAAIRGGTLHIIHAWRFEGESLLRRGRAQQPAAYVDELVEAEYLQASNDLKRVSERAEVYGVPFELYLQKGHPGDVIPETISHIRPGVVVLGTLARTGLQGMFIGNTAEQILGVVEASVLAAKPDDFISPIAPD